MNKQTRLNIRADEQQKEMIARAARLSGMTISDFVLKESLQKAHEIVGEESEFRLSEEKWRLFCEALDRPPSDLKELRELLNQPSIFETHGK